jgi:SAM-dependent methyltransferase
MASLEWNRRWGVEFGSALAKGEGAGYGLQWGDPSLRGFAYWLRTFGIGGPRPIGPLFRVVDEYIEPFLKPGMTALEIGPGAGRWTRYLLSAGRLVLVDIDETFLQFLAANLSHDDIVTYRSDGFDMSGIPSASVHYVFCFGTFVTIEPKRVRTYLREIKRVMKNGGVAVVQYAAANKPRAKLFVGFEQYSADEIERWLNMTIIQHDKTMFNYCNILVARRDDDG